ncbi:hypothetical protein VIGAN_04350100, partial [Vigna angularis var. angularis]
TGYPCYVMYFFHSVKVNPNSCFLLFNGKFLDSPGWFGHLVTCHQFHIRPYYTKNFFRPLSLCSYQPSFQTSKNDPISGLYLPICMWIFHRGEILFGSKIPT